MAIRNKRAFDRERAAGFDGVFEWDHLIAPIQKVTGRAIEPMDIDCHIEIGGHHLIFETKSPGENVKTGQWIALMQLWAKGYHTVVFQWGKQYPITVKVFYPSGRTQCLTWDDLQGKEPDEIEEKANKKWIVDFVERWARWANKKNNRTPFQYNGNDETVEVGCKQSNA